MVDFDTSSPKSKAVKQLLDAYISLDLNNLKPLISKDYQYEPLPKSPDTDTANQGKEDHIQKWGEIFSLLTKFDMIFHEIIDAPEKVVVHATCLFSIVSGPTVNYETIITYTFVEEDGGLKILRCKDFANPLQRSALFAGAIKAAAERVAA